MGTLKSFEELDVWKAARALSKEIYTVSMSGSFAKDYPLRDQINRAAGSIMDNIAEGFDRGGNKEFLQYPFIAKGSSAEVRSQIHRALDRGHINQKESQRLIESATRISRQLASLIHYLRTSTFRGEKYVMEPDQNYQNLEP